MEGPVQRGEQLWSGEGISIWTTDQAERLILQFEEERVCEVACRIQALLTKHALSSSFLERLDSRSVLFRRVEPLPVQAVVEATAGDARLTFQGDVDGMPKARLAMMEDVAVHAARSLRAHLSLHGIERIRSVVRFGLTSDGACLLQVVNPLNCDLGTTDMERLADMLGG